MSNDGYLHLLPDNKRIKVKSGENLMKALADQGIFLRSDCGGKGTCKKCRVKVFTPIGAPDFHEACQIKIDQKIFIEIPEGSMARLHMISKPPVVLPEIFTQRFRHVDRKARYGIATDLGTTTITVYLCNTTRGKVLASLSAKNPQALYGEDIMNRISAINLAPKNLKRLQALAIRAIEGAIRTMVAAQTVEMEMISQMVTVGNPTMIHIFTGINPQLIGFAPFQPAFFEAQKILSTDIGFTIGRFSIKTLPQVSGFIGGDIIGAAVAVDLENQPQGTLLVDLGTNGELMLKGKDAIFATSCATGPAFEGASLSCGMQAMPGAIKRVRLKGLQDKPEYEVIHPFNTAKLKPAGICGTGVISAIAQFYQKSIITADGAFNKTVHSPTMGKGSSGRPQFNLVLKNESADGTLIFINQKDIRSVQLGKSALITGIEMLMNTAGIAKPQKILIAGAFGSYLDKADLATLGMIPEIDLSRVNVVGNAAGTGAVMALCDDAFLEKAIHIANHITVVDLPCDQNFQNRFIQNLSFPILKNGAMA